MAGLHDLTREYEARRFPVSRRLDLHADGPQAARDRALRWIQSYAHEEPGQELLLIVERGTRPGGKPGPVRRAVEELLGDLEGKLLEWWQSFGPGSLAVRIAREPRMQPFPREAPVVPKGEGRTPETAGAAFVPPAEDIPPELLGLAMRAAELRRTREGASVRLLDVLLRQVWIEAQATAMVERITFGAALSRILAEEQAWEFDE